MPVPAGLSKLRDVVKNDVVKKVVYDKLAAKVNNIYTCDFVQTDKTRLGKKFPDVTSFVKKAKLTELGNKIPDVSSLVRKTALTAVENKISDVSSLVKKQIMTKKSVGLKKKLTDHNQDKHITTPEFNTLASSVFNARLAQADLIAKTDFDTKLSSLNRKITANKAKHLLIGNEFKKLKAFYSSYFKGRNYFEEDGTQKYLVFSLCTDLLNKLLVLVTSTTFITDYWKSKGLSDERTNSITYNV